MAFYPYIEEMAAIFEVNIRVVSHWWVECEQRLLLVLPKRPVEALRNSADWALGLLQMASSKPPCGP